MTLYLHLVRPAFLIIFLILLCAHGKPGLAQDIVGGASRTNLSGPSAQTPGRNQRRPKTKYVTNTRDVTATRTVVRGANTGSIIVSAEPGASVVVEPVRGGTGEAASIPQGVDQIAFNKLPPGRYRVAASLDGYADAEREVIVRAGEPTIVSMNLQPVLYTVTISTNVSKGEIRYAPLIARIDPATRHTLYNRAPGDVRVTPITGGRAVLSNLRSGTYGLDIRAEQDDYVTLLGSITLPGPTYIVVGLKRSSSSAGRSLVHEDEDTLSRKLAFARYYALLIGNNSYLNIPPLKMAENDAREVEAVLRQQYGFETRLLLNATRHEIIKALNEYRRNLGTNANLLIYYAGHGYNDRDVDTAYWLPIDAQPQDNSNWISADDITRNIKGIPAKHVLVVSDSCYSGTLVREAEIKLTTPQEREKYLQKMMEGKSRTLMASGGNEPVADGGGGSNSVFANALLRGFSQIDKDVFTAEELFYSFIRERVAGRASQTPEYNPLRNSGHESGDFVFVRKK
jgi:uncharacterized caspase-like protein